MESTSLVAGIVGARLVGDGLPMDTLGKRIAHARKLMPGQVTQRELGDLVGINSNSVSRWERDAHEDPSVESVARFAQALGVRVEWLAHGTGPMRDAPASVTEPVDDDAPYVRDEILERVIGDWPAEAQRHARDMRRSIGPEMTADILITNLRAIARRHRLPVELRLASGEGGLYVDRADLGDEQRL